MLCDSALLACGLVNAWAGGVMVAKLQRQEQPLDAFFAMTFEPMIAAWRI